MDHAGIDRPGADRIDADTLPGDLAGGGFRQPDDRMLRGDIGWHAGGRDEPRNRRGVDNRALLLLEHDGQHMPQPEKYAFDIDADDLIEHRLVILGGVFDAAFDAGIVEEAVDLAVSGDRFFDIVRNIGRFCDIRLYEARLAALLLDDAGRRLAARCVAVDDDDLGARFRESERGGAPDAVARAGDQRDLAGKIEIHWILPYFFPP